MRPRLLPLLLLLAFFTPGLKAEDKTLRLGLGDPARKDRQVSVTLDAVTDTRDGALLTPAEMAARLAGARLVLVGESHTEMDFHRAQLRVIEELARSGREVFVGLEMYPYTQQAYLDQWVNGLLTEEGFLRLSRWYEHWGYHWDYYRDIFLFARDHKVRLFAVNAPRAVVTQVRKQGFASLTPEQAAHIPQDVDTTSADHRTLFKSYFEADDPLHSGMTEEQWNGMISAQATWDATMAHNAVKALGEHGGPNTVMVVLVGSGHVVYGLGIARQAAAHGFEGRIATVVPVNVKEADGTPIEKVQATYADFVWGLPQAAGPLYPSTGLSTAADTLKAILVAEKSPAEKAGFKTGDLLLALDGTPLPDKEALNRLMAGKRWGDSAVFTVERGAEKVEVRVVFRR